MASRFVYWDGESGITHPNGRTYTAEENMEMLPFMRTQKVVLELSGDIAIAIDSLPTLESIYQIDLDLSDEEKLVEIEKARLRAQDPNYDEIEEIIADLEADLEG